MRYLINKPIIFCTIVILINIAVQIYVRSQLKSTSVNLTYKIFDINTTEGSVSVRLDIEEVNTNKLTFDVGLPVEFQALEIHSVHDSVGKPIKYSYSVDSVEKRKKVSYSASKLVVPLKRKQKFVRIVYQVRVGKENLPQNSAIKSIQTTPGSLSDNFGMFCGSNVFLLPRTQIDQVKIQMTPSNKWDIVSTVQKSGNVGEYRIVSEGPKQAISKQAILSTVIGLGKFTEYTKQMGPAVVKIYVNEGFSPHGSDIANTAFSIYQSLIDLFGATAEQYTFIFTPAGEGNNIWRASNSMGVGATLTMPATETQWFDLARNIFYKWNRYSAKSRSDPPQDKWFIEGASLYNSVQILSKLGILNKDRNMLTFYREYYSMYPYKQLPSQDFYMSKPEFHVDLMNLPEIYKSTYWTMDNSTRKTVEAKSVVFTAHLDNWISEQSQGKYNLNDVLKHRYNPHAKSQSLMSDIQQVTNLDATECFVYTGGDARPIPYKDIRAFGKLEKKPRHREGDIEIAEYGQTLVAPPDHWEKDRTLTFLISSNTRAFLETCGCLLSQSGGVARMATVVRQELKKNPNLVLFSAGNAFPGRSVEEDIDELELSAFLDSFEMMGYDFAAVTELELLYGYPALKKHSKTLSFPFICANIYDGNHSIFKPYVLKKMGNYSIGFLGISQEIYASPLTSMYQSQTAHLRINDPIEIIDRYLPELRKTCDLVVLVGRLDVAMIDDILDHTDQIDLIITPLSLSKWSINSSGEVYFGRWANGFLGNTLIWVCDGQTYALDKLELNMGVSGKIRDFRYASLELSESVEDAPDVRQYLKRFYSQIAKDEKVGFDKPIFSWEQSDREFVGVGACKSCHLEEYHQWSQTKHAFAYNTLLQKHRHFSPKCVMCHVTGGGYDSGYTFGSPDRSLVNVQCEMCHGPGSTHIKAPLQVNMLRRPPKRLCVACHDSEHSDFYMKTYYPKVKH